MNRSCDRTDWQRETRHIRENLCGREHIERLILGIGGGAQEQQLQVRVKVFPGDQQAGDRQEVLVFGRIVIGDSDGAFKHIYVMQKVDHTCIGRSQAKIEYLHARRQQQVPYVL